jgi:hypothetical protein
LTKDRSGALAYRSGAQSSDEVAGRILKMTRPSRTPWLRPRTLAFGAASLIVLSGVTTRSQNKKSNAQIKREMIEFSIARYVSRRETCPCPYSLDPEGNRCDARSAYNRLVGARPLCYESDITQTMVEAYRKRTGE